MEISKKYEELKTKYGMKILIVVAAVLMGVGIVYGSKYLALREVNNYVSEIKQDWASKNQAIFDNIAMLKAQNQALEDAIKNQRIEITNIRNAKRKEWKDVKGSKDPKAIASYFDNTVDHYIPER